MRNEWCIYHHVSTTGTTIFALHVNDIIAASSSVDKTNRFKVELKAHWDISDLGPAKFALGIAITRDTINKTISICQSAFINHILAKFNQSDAHPCDTLMLAGLQLTCPDKLLPVPPNVID
jgi:hypothetical protein